MVEFERRVGGLAMTQLDRSTTRQRRRRAENHRLSVRPEIVDPRQVHHADSSKSITSASVAGSLPASDPPRAAKARAIFAKSSRRTPDHQAAPADPAPR